MILLYSLFSNSMPPAHVAQSVERVLGKDEVGGSNPLVGSTYNINTVSYTHLTLPTILLV